MRLLPVEEPMEPPARGVRSSSKVHHRAPLEGPKGDKAVEGARELMAKRRGAEERPRRYKACAPMLVAPAQTAWVGTIPSN